MENASECPVPHGTASEPPPLYTEKKQDVQATVLQIVNTLEDADKARLPVLAGPSLRGLFRQRSIEDDKIHAIVETFFGAIATGNVELVSAFLGANLITTETTNQNEKTPLLAAIESEQTHMVRYLLDIGAEIDAYGVTDKLYSTLRRGRQFEQNTDRTPIQYAAQLGNLPIVRLLIERGADDAMIAPDGQLALRLAASNGHREVVEYLPSRRGGGFQRWKTKHATAMRRCKRASHKIYEYTKFFAWDLPKFFVWSIPKHIIALPLIEVAKWIRKQWKELPKMVADTAKDIADRFSKFVPRAWSTIKELPREIRNLLTRCVHRTWKALKSIPGGTKILFHWLWKQATSVGRGIGRFIALIVSGMHTICVAVLSFFRRITLQDVMNGFKVILHAIVVDLPKSIWKGICSAGAVSRKVLVAIFGGFGKCLWFLVELLMAGIFYVPEKVLEIVSACGSSARNGGKEVMVWFDPKRV